MKRRTSNIILVVKGNHNYEENGQKIWGKRAIAKYMTETCGVEEQAYTDKRLLKIIQAVVLDYIATADQPESLLFDYFDAASTYKYDQLESWITALMRVQVREVVDNDYNKGFAFVNGFNEGNINVISENTGEKMFVDKK